MHYLIISLSVFTAAYLLNSFYITVLYHRGLTHGAVKLSPNTRKFVIATGSWVTGIDPKAWSCMHRLHHQYSDTPLDPHSPMHQGLFNLLMGQLNSYNRTLRNLIRGEAKELSMVPDLDFEVSWLNRNRVWYLPYLLHGAIALSAGVFFGAWLLGAAYFLGIMSHPMQGWMVNSLAHSFGYRNFETADNSRNHTLTAWLVMGEGYQNNHHHRPSAAKFSAKAGEFDGGYLMCLAAERFGWIRIAKSNHSDLSASKDA